MPPAVNATACWRTLPKTKKVLMTDKPKLELTWIGKDKRPRLEPRILIEDKSLSYRADIAAPSQGDLLADAPTQVFHDNLLIQGDNLLALKALEAKYAGKVKCVFIDPPYNTGSAFTHYDDGVEHSLWLTLIRDRLEIIRNLLAEEGSLWITIDDTEAHYLKVLCDEIFGRRNFVANVVWQKRTAPDNRLKIGDAHDSILVYCKDLNVGKAFLNQLPISEKRAKDFRNPDSDPRGAWTSDNLTGMTGHATASQFYVITTPSGEQYPPPEGRCWALSEDTFKKLLSENRIWFGKEGNSRPRLKRFLSEISGRNSWTWWPNDEVGHNQEANQARR